ncbi:pcp-3, partial [Pristionchus pacificus]
PTPAEMRLLLVVALAALAAAVPDMFMGRRRGGFTSHLLKNRVLEPSELAATGGDTFTQKLDHFDSSNTATWSQRYWYNHAYDTANSNVNFLYLSGEQDGSLGFIVGLSQAPVYYAQQLNADLYTLEHRFYGKSHPTKDTSVENLRFLSSQQAIEDIADFVRKISADKGGDQKWIIIGGSYAGALSSWVRLKHPELFVGSIASSGPVLAQLDFYGYLQTVDADFKKQGGLCYDQISKGLDEANKLWQTAEGRATLTQKFKIRPALSAYDDLTDMDKDTFFSYLINQFEGAAQYNQPSIPTVCKEFTIHGDSEDPLDAFTTLVPFAVNVNFTASVEEFKSTAFVGDISTRLWIYQTCAEFGYFQSTNRGTNVFGQTQSSNSFIEYCVQLFGIDADQIQKNIDYTNAYYGERDYYAGTNVVFGHGTQDPWSFLAKKDDARHESVVILEVEGGSHCQDIGETCLPNVAGCTDNMKQVQSITLENLRKWIDPKNVVPDHIDIDNNVGKAPIPVDAAAAVLRNKDKPAATPLRAERTKETPMHKKKIDFTKWNKFTGKGRKVLLPPPAEDVETVTQNSATSGQDWFVQTWDHFNASETRTFKQQWFYNYKFGSTSGPNFLMIGGEGPEDSSWVMNEKVAWSTYAQSVGANLFLLEHRYYGKSKLGTNDLQYLTSEQMLYDVAIFIKAQQANQKLTGPWITFGGSYPGALAAWSREWFPDLILGAVGSSGPVLAKNDFYEYLEVVESVIKRQSQKCYDRTTQAFASFHKLLNDADGRVTLQEKFRFFPAWSAATLEPLDMNDALSALYGLFQGTVQYNAVDWSDVKNLCSYFENDSKYPDPLDALSALRYAEYGVGALLADFDDDMQYYIKMKDHVDGHDTVYSDDSLAGILWTWQTCNEFGYYQTTDYGDGIFGTPVPVNFFVIMCERVFGTGMDQVEGGIKSTNNAYGGRYKYSATHVVLPNGDADPWHALGILERTADMDESVVPIVINGTSHCADMYGASKADPPELTQARKTVLENIQKWLAPADPYCGCSVDASGAPSGWAYNDIWLDVVVIVDTSEAMSQAALDNAGALVESLISDGVTDYLITDTKATYSTRVGVIDMSDSAKVLYNMNMKKGDKVIVSIKKGVKEINVLDAFTAATNMFAGAATPDRAFARQVVFYITETDPKQNLGSLDAFKSSNGVIIVNSQSSHSGLSGLASEGYTFLNTNNKKTLQAFCKANCFCKPGKTAYSTKDKAIQAAGGCFDAYTANTPFPKAQQQCANANGIIAVDHDGAKGEFLAKVLSDASIKSDFFWIGYSKNDAGTWFWEDQSTDSYTNWAPGEPNSAAVAKCAYVDTTTDGLQWGAGNCNVGFPYVCEDKPCSVGYKNC